MPRLHPALIDIYKRKIDNLAAALNADATRSEAAEIMRSLIDDIRLLPEAGELKIELSGALAGILALARKRPRGGTTRAQLTLVAGAGSHLYRTRLPIESQSG